MARFLYAEIYGLRFTALSLFLYKFTDHDNHFVSNMIIDLFISFLHV